MTLGERYQVGGRLGEGGMALVYQTTDERLGREVALKMLRPQYAGDPEFVARFEREAQNAARLAHPNIAQVFDTGRDGEYHYIVMERLGAFTLKDMIGHSPNARIEPGEAVRIGREIAAALAHAHQHGVIHRDIKPQNVLFTDDGHVKVTDFGIARALSAASGTATGTILGSPHYISPEQASGQTAGPSSDIYSLGVVMYEMLTGHTPYQGETPVAIALQHLRAEPTPIRQVAPGVPPALEQVVARAMNKQPDQRFASARAFADALAAAILGRPAPVGADATTVMQRPVAPELEPAESDEPAVPSKLSPRRPVSPWLAVAATLLVVGSIGFGVAMAGRQRGPDLPPDISITSQPDPEPKQIIVEDLVGQDVDAARDRLDRLYRSQGLEPPQVVEIERQDNAVPRNQILSQDPQVGSTIAEGGMIRVVVSTGVQQVAVPDLVGLTLARAKATLSERGFLVGTVGYDHSDKYVLDTVVAQGVASGANLPAGSGLDLTVSLGPSEQAPPPDVNPDDGDRPPADRRGEKALVSIGGPHQIDEGLQVATVVVSVLPDRPAAKVKLVWEQGGTGEAGGGEVEPGGMFTADVRGVNGSVLAVYVDGVVKERVQY